MIVRILIIAAVLLFLIFWVRALLDLFTHRHDLSVGAKVVWAIAMLVFPFIGLLDLHDAAPDRPHDRPERAALGGFGGTSLVAGA